MSDDPVAPRAVALPPGLVPALARGVAAFLRADAAALAALALPLGAAVATGHLVVAHGVAVLALALLANALHELGHIAAYRLLAPRGRAVLECGTLTARLHRDALARRRDRIVTVAGPLTPLAAAAGSLPLLPVAPAEVIAASALGLAHASSLLLPTADRRAWRRAASSPAEQAAPTLGA
ncbi:MAG: hypothetical protein EAS51_00130 [Microbacteriaceae bacterium]|nr:MAG: hypothetical protein EAS51_00130 [Microbacteriaceae bacterium]